MADYKIGKLVFEIEANTQKAIKSLKDLSSSLNKIQTANLDKVGKKLKEIEKLDFSKLASVFKPLEELDVKSLNAASRVLTTMSKLNLDNVDFGKLKSQFIELKDSVSPFVDKLIEAEPALNTFNKSVELKKINFELDMANAKLEKIHLQNQKIGLQADKIKITNDTLLQKRSGIILKNGVIQSQQNKINLQTQKEANNLERSKVQLEKSNLQLEITKKRLEDINKTDNRYRQKGSILHTLFNIGKVYWAINYARRMATSIAKIFTTAIDFNEVLNKFQVSMGEFYDDSVKFVDKLTKAFNLSTASIMNYMSTFKNMLDALGNIGGADTYELSQTLTRMAIDYASLFNVEIEKAMQQFQAVLSGQIRSIRTTAGYDVSESTIYNIYKSLGGTKTSRQLDQTEKRLLRIIALQKQMNRTGAVGDFAKTINNAANMLKELSETMKEAARWAAQLAMNYLTPLIEKTLGFAMALRDALESINKARGYVYEDFGKGGLFGEIEESATNAEDAVNSLKRNLLGLDKLNILGSSSATGTTQEDYSLLLNAIKGYTSTLDNVQSKASAIRDRIMEWLGFTKDANGEWEKTGDRLDTIKEKGIAIFEIIAGFALATKIVTFIGNLGKVSTILTGIGETLNGVGFAKIGVIATLVVSLGKAFKDLYTDDEEFRAELTSNLEKLGGNLSNLFGSVVKIFDKVTDILSECLKPIAKFITFTILPLINTILDYVNKIVDRIEEAIDGLMTVFNPDYEPKTIGGQNFAYQWNEQAQPLKDAGDWILNIPQHFDDFRNYLDDTFEDWWDAITGIFNGRKQPRLASGGVVSKPTMAMVGEYSGASSNPEIIAPENKLRGIFSETMLPLVRAIVNGDERLINAVNDLADRPVELNGRKVSENIFDDLQDVAIRKGKMLYNV